MSYKAGLVAKEIKERASEVGLPIDRFFYPLRAPSSITYASNNNSLIFADTDNNRIMRISLFDGNIYYLVANAGR